MLLCIFRIPEIMKVLELLMHDCQIHQNILCNNSGLNTTLVTRRELTGEGSSETSMCAELRQISPASLSGVSTVDDLSFSVAGESIAFGNMKFQKILLPLLYIHYQKMLPLQGFGCLSSPEGFCTRKRLFEEQIEYVSEGPTQLQHGMLI